MQGEVKRALVVLTRLTAAVSDLCRFCLADYTIFEAQREACDAAFRELTMNFYLWTDEIIADLAEHDVAPEDFEVVVDNPTKKGRSDSTGRPCVWGYTEDGRHLIAVFQRLDELTILPVTAYEVPEECQKRRRGKRKP